ncbi:MAG: hypothetical protein DGJ47_000166 [Rickettsiaceae bacterium]
MKKGVIKLQAPFEKIRNLNCSPEVKLYKAIILQAIIDASNNSDNMVAVKIESSAREWLFNDSKWLNDVCDKAKLEVCYVRKTAKGMIKHNSKNICDL